MLNRIYIIVGIVAILALASAFIVPRFIQWGDYRDRMELLAEGVFGTEVTIRGDIDFALLPAPRLAFSDVIIGPIDRPAATVGGIEAQFALMDFLRDRYNLSALTLKSPTIAFELDENGLFTSGIDLSAAGDGVKLEQARIEAERAQVASALEAQRKALGETLYAYYVFGRKAGALPGYAYSSAMKDADFIWDERTLDRFIADPDAVVPGNSMKPYGGLTSPELRRSLISYLGAKSK